MLPPLFNRIAETVPTLQGWCESDKAQRLAACVVALRPTVTVEIGVYGGASFIPMALAAQYNEHGRVVGIDPWTVEASTEGMSGPNLDWWGKLDHQAIYRGFIDKVLTLGLKDRVKIIPLRSDQVKIDAEIGPVIDICHIDGAHHIQAALYDANNYALRVRVGGLCFLDDIEWSDGGPKKAAEVLLKSGFVEIWRAGTGAMFQRVAPGLPKPAVKPAVISRSLQTKRLVKR